MLQPSPLWDGFRKSFAKQVKAKIKSLGIDQRTLSEEIKIPESTLSLQLNKNLRPWFVDRIAELWPDEFSHAPGEARRAMLGGAPATSGEATHLRAMLLMFTQMKEHEEKGIT